MTDDLHNHNHDHDHDHDHDHEGHEHITIINENGDEELFEVLFTFDSEDFNKSYILMYPAGDSDEEDGAVEIQAYAFVPNEDGEDGELLPIETDEEWDMIEEVLNTFVEDEYDN